MFGGVSWTGRLCVITLTAVTQTGNDADTDANPFSVAAATSSTGQLLLATANTGDNTVLIFQVD
jgi:hypothetical protein